MQALLAESAAHAWRSAPTACREDPATGERCAWYHGLWQCLRLMGLVDMSERHAAFFREQLTALGGGTRAPRILISGAADYWMLENVLAAFRGRGPAPEVTVVDLCDTPLEVNRWYAARAGVRILAARSDIRAYEAQAPFDAICSHAILGRFLPAERAELLARWRALLRPGGVAVTVTPVRPGDEHVPVGFPPEQQRAYGATVLAAAEAASAVLPAAPGELARMAELYASRHRVHRVNSAADLQAMFERAGLRVDQLARLAPSAPVRAGAAMGGGAGTGLQGPTVTGSAEYACIAASRR